MNKTPVSILQEMMVKQGMTPDYELIYDGGGRHINTFTYKVTCDGLSANGTGRCKKDAKHEAAKAMLSEIAAHKNYPQLPAASTPAVSPARSPFHSVPLPPNTANVPFFNAIGELQDLCANNNLKDPEYILIKDTGPPHARIFTIRCIVSNFTEDGIATTKKQAKHDAAKKMVERIKGLLNESPTDEDDLSNLSITTTETDAMNKNAKDQYRSLIKSKKVNLGIKLADYHLYWRNSLEVDKRNKILKELYSTFPDRLSDLDEYITNDLIKENLNKFEQILSEINVYVDWKDLAADNNYYMKVIELNTCPIVTQIGMGKNNVEATWKALCQMIDAVKLLLL